jgi:hypothetical protein
MVTVVATVVAAVVAAVVTLVNEVALPDVCCFHTVTVILTSSLYRFVFAALDSHATYAQSTRS